MKAEPTHENEGIGGTSGQDGTVTVLTSSQDSINIATELQNSHHQESPESWLNESPTTRDVIRGRPETGRRGRDMEWSGHTLACGR